MRGKDEETRGNLGWVAEQEGGGEGLGRLGERQEEQGQEGQDAGCVFTLQSEPCHSAPLVFGPRGQSHLLQETGG